MRLAQVTHQLIGNQLIEPVYTEHGSMLLQKGTVVNNAIIEKLLSHNVNVVHVIDQAKRGIEEVMSIPQPKVDEAVQHVTEVFNEVLMQDNLGVKAVIPLEQISMVKDMVSLLIDSLSKSEDMLFCVYELIGTDSYTYRHSVNVAILTILTAKALGYKESEVKDIALGALLHDIGKARVNQTILQKPSSLTPTEILEIQRHPTLGYELIEAIEGLPYLAKQIVLLHHEKLDGSGYPYGIKGIEIPEYVQIVTICDMYDAMTTNRVYRDKMPVYQVLDILMAECVFRISPRILKVMTSTICIFAPGSGVVLSDGRVGIVSSYKAINPSRPRIRILNLDAVMHHIDVQEVNLEKQTTLFIIDVWDVETFKRNVIKRSEIIQLHTKTVV